MTPTTLPLLLIWVDEDNQPHHIQLYRSGWRIARTRATLVFRRKPHETKDDFLLRSEELVARTLGNAIYGTHLIHDPDY